MPEQVHPVIWREGSHVGKDRDVPGAIRAQLPKPVRRYPAQAFPIRVILPFPVLGVAIAVFPEKGCQRALDAPSAFSREPRDLRKERAVPIALKEGVTVWR